VSRAGFLQIKQVIFREALYLLHFQHWDGRFSHSGITDGISSSQNGVWLRALLEAKAIEADETVAERQPQFVTDGSIYRQGSEISKLSP
jgi:hypothetical protein